MTTITGSCPGAGVMGSSWLTGGCRPTADVRTSAYLRYGLPDRRPVGPAGRRPAAARRPFSPGSVSAAAPCLGRDAGAGTVVGGPTPPVVCVGPPVQGRCRPATPGSPSAQAAVVT